MIRRLRIKFVCIIMLIVTIMLGVIFGMVLHFMQINLETQSIRMMQQIHSNMPPYIINGEGPEEIRTPYILVETDMGGGVFSFTAQFYESLEEPFVRSLVDAAFNQQARTGILKEYNLRFLKIASPGGERIIFADISMERAMLSDLVRGCIVVACISYLLFLLISIFLSGWAIRPVEFAWNQQHQFVADASHELKTPLTVILTNAELLQSGDYGPEDNRKFTSSILAMTHQMRGLVEGLLELARVDNGAVKMVFSEMDLGELIGEELLPFEPMFFERELEVETCLEPGVTVRGSETHLRQILNILLDNASKYSLTPGRVRVELKRQGSFCILSVSNPCHEISRKDLKNIFRRFYRMDKARAMSHSYGLGLSIAEALVRDHKGRIWAESKEGNIIFHVLLPALFSGPARNE